MLPSLGDLGVRLDAVAKVVQEIADQVRSCLAGKTGEFRSEEPRRLEQPAHRSHRVSRALWPDARLAVAVGLALQTRPRTAHPFSEHRSLCKVDRCCDDRAAAQSGRLGDPGLPGRAQHLHHRGPQQPTLALGENSDVTEKYRDRPSSLISASAGHIARLVSARILGYGAS